MDSDVPRSGTTTEGCCFNFDKATRIDSVLVWYCVCSLAVNRWWVMNMFSLDLRYALRRLLHSRAFTAVAVLTIGVGIGANATVFGWVHGLLLNPVPGSAEPERLVAVESVAANGDPLT